MKSSPFLIIWRRFTTEVISWHFSYEAGEKHALYEVNTAAYKRAQALLLIWKYSYRSYCMTGIDI